MRIGLATVQVPFIRGGAENLAGGLLRALREAGHEAEIISMPFRFGPVSEVLRSMAVWAGENFGEMNGFAMDRVICLKFPAYFLRHQDKVVWLLHQHRPVYDLWETPYSGDLPRTEEGRGLKRVVTERDTRALESCQRVFTIAGRVSDRLRHYNKVASTPLYHPPALAEQFYSAPPEPYIFFPSRLEDLKRQELLIRAMRFVSAPVTAILAGEGGRKQYLQSIIDELSLGDRVRLIGRVSDLEMLAYYAHSLGVFFGPYDEDYGYVTLEAMLASKPVITCTDSGGPLEFVVDGETGLIAAPTPEAVGNAINTLCASRKRAAEMVMG